MKDNSRRTFVKQTAATGLTFTFAGLIRAHGQSGGGTTMQFTSWNSTFNTTMYFTTNANTTMSFTSEVQTTGMGTYLTTEKEKEEETTEEKYETREVPEENFAYKTITKHYMECRPKGSGNGTSQAQWIEQNSPAPSWSPGNPADANNPEGDYPPPPNSPTPPDGDGWEFMGWKEGMIELMASLHATDGQVVSGGAAGAPTEGGETGIGLPEGMEWTGKHRTDTETRKVPYSCTSKWRRKIK